MEKIIDVLFFKEYSGISMKNIFFKFISNLFSFEKKNQKKLNNVKFLKIYLDSVGERSYSVFNGEYAVNNREFHKPVWNKYVEHKTDYEIFKKQID